MTTVETDFYTHLILSLKRLNATTRVMRCKKNAAVKMDLQKKMMKCHLRTGVCVIRPRVVELDDAGDAEGK